MKKTFFILFAVTIFSIAGSAQAADSCGFNNSFACPSGQTCSNGSCVPTPTGSPCGFSTNFACPSGQTCSNGSCVLQPTDSSCGFSNNFTCPSGQTCSNGTCVPLPTYTPPAPSGYVPVITIPGLTDAKSTLVVNQSTLANFLNNLYKYLIGIAAILAVLEIIWGGILISTQRDSISSHSEGRKKIEHAIGGLALVLLPALVFSIINPGILNLSVNLPPIDLKTPPPPASTQSQTPQTTTDAKTGCSVIGSVLKKATCSTQQAAQDFAASCSGSILPCQQENSSGCVDKTYTAVCSTTKGPYVFIDTSSSGFSAKGILNAIIGYSYYEPLAHSDSNPNNGAEVMQFVSACKSDQGTICLSNNVLSTTCTYSSGQATSQSNTCYSKNITCTDSHSSFYSTQTCSDSPTFQIIQ